MKLKLFGIFFVCLASLNLDGAEAEEHISEYDIPGVLAQARQSARMARYGQGTVQSYLAMLPKELHDQLVDIINQELFQYIPSELRPKILRHLHGRLWVDLSKEEKWLLLRLLMDHFSKTQNPEEILDRLVTMSHILHLKDFHAVAEEESYIHDVKYMINEKIYPPYYYEIIAFLHTSGSQKILKRNIKSPENKYSMELILMRALKNPFLNSWNASFRIISSLLDAGIPPNLILEKMHASEQNTPILIFAIMNSVPYEIIKLLIDKGADVNSQREGQSALSIAREMDNLDPDVISLLIEHGAK